MKKERFMIVVLLLLFTTLINAKSVSITNANIDLGEVTTLKAVGYNEGDDFLWKTGITKQETYADKKVFHFLPNISGEYIIELFVNGKSESNTTVTVTSSVPVVAIDAGADQSICLGEKALLVASVPSNSTLEWKIDDEKYADGPVFHFLPKEAGVYTVNLIGNSEEDSLTVTVSIDCGNHTPIANAGSDQTQPEGIIELNGNGSSDADGDILTYAWNFIAKPAGSLATLSDTTLVNPTFNADVIGTYTLQLIVNDGTVSSVADVIHILIDPSLVNVKILPDMESINKLICATIPNSTEVFQKVDIMFLVDVSGSYGDDLSIFRTRADEIMSAFSAAGKDVNIALASFSDYPVSPYGSSRDYAFRLDQPLTNDFSLVTTAINNLALLSGGDYRESQLEGLFQSGESATGWRDGALPIIFLATDAAFHNSDDETAYPGHGLTETVASLTAKGIKVFGLQSGGSIADVIEIAHLTDGKVFNLSSNSSEIVAAIEEAILGTSTDFTVTLEVTGAIGGLIESITPNIAGANSGDAIENVNSGDDVCFNVVFTRGIYTAEAISRVIYFKLKVVGEGVATIKEIPIKLELLR